MRWKTDDIIKLVKEVCGEGYIIHSFDPGGSCDTESIQIHRDGLQGDWIDICGFLCGGCYGESVDKSDCDAEMIQLRTNGDSCGGIQTEDEPLAIAAITIQTRLLNLGWGVCGQLKAYF